MVDFKKCLNNITIETILKTWFWRRWDWNFFFNFIRIQRRIITWCVQLGIGSCFISNEEFNFVDFFLVLKHSSILSCSCILLSHLFLILLLLLNLYFPSILLAPLVMIFYLLVKLLIDFHICASCKLLYFKSFVDIYNNYQSKILNHEKPI